MTDMARQLLEELMNQYQGTSKDFRDPDVCKDHLVNFCPNLLFTNTKADLGSCELIHDDRLSTEYKSSSDYKRLGYEESFYNRLHNLLSDLDRKIRRAFERVSTEADDKVINPEKEENQESVILLEEKIKTILENIENAGEEGRVEEAKSLTDQLEKLKTELKAAQEKANTINPMFKNEKKLEVCDVCGAFLVPDDDTRRLDAHIEGKQHQGYLKIREALAEHKKTFERSARRTSNERKSTSGSRYQRSRSRERTSSRRRYSRSRSGERASSRRRYSRSRSKERSSSKSRNKYKERSRYRSRERYNR
ncbi:Luc7-like protein 3 [Smittium culicis]|uniref:Luc7-like protein 3 n=1 Tax=Smittium culicis TaxID=133412 RepID=A0A1R1Y2R4_9FUNG|nr:Luc7-like protein 3 [Smittium culicis]